MKKNILKIFIAALILTSTAMPHASSAFSVSTYSVDPSSITDTSAILRGRADPDTAWINNSSQPIPTTAYFRYAELLTPPVFCNDIYGSEMVSTEDRPIIYWNQSFSQGIGCPSPGDPNDASCLEPDTTYYYCAIASSKQGIAYGNVVSSFTTSPCLTCNPTSIKTYPATDITKNSARLRGFLNTSKQTQAWFEYRKNSGKISSAETFGPWKTVGKQNFQQGYAQPVVFNAGGLQTNTGYSYRAVAQKTGGGPIIYGEIVNFKTKGASSSNPCPPYVSPFVPDVDAVARINPYEGSTGGGSISTLGIGLGPTTGQRTISGSVIINPPTGGPIFGSFPPFLPSLGDPCPPENPPPRPGYFPITFTGPSGPFGPSGEPVGPGTGGLTSYGVSVDAVVRFHEGVEHVFVRQIIGTPAIALMYGYQSHVDLTEFANDLAHFLAILFGYYENGKEIRVLPPDIAAYELKVGSDGLLMVNEYYAGNLISSRSISDIFKKPAASYEYNYYRRI